MAPYGTLSAGMTGNGTQRRHRASSWSVISKWPLILLESALWARLRFYVSVIGVQGQSKVSAIGLHLGPQFLNGR